MKPILSIITLLTTIALSADKPNFIIIYTDDQGYGDLSCYGGTHVDTPRIDQMANEGAKLSSFYMAAAVCTPSRAALMTGSYPERVDMSQIIISGSKKGLHPDEITVAEILKSQGYATGIFGKWHLGDQPEFLPTRQGFDEFFGLPYSHDIHPSNPLNGVRFDLPPLPLLEGETVIEEDPDADYLTQRFTQRAMKFIEKNKDKPFFLYLPHPMPHVPAHASPEFMKDVPEEVLTKLKEENGKIDYDTRRKIFRQCVREIDWSVGQILDTLKSHGLDENTMVLFTTDNGPVLGNAGPLKGAKGSFYEGGHRVPTVVRWPGKIPAGVDIAETMTGMDILPTFAKLAGAEVPTDRVIDGKDVSNVLQKGASTPHEAFFYYRARHLAAVRSGKWKLHLVKYGQKGKLIKDTPSLYNLDSDIGEKHDILADHPEIAARLKQYADQFLVELEQNKRPSGLVENPVILSLER